MKLRSLTLRRGAETQRAVFAVASDNELSLYEADPAFLLCAGELAQWERIKFAPKRQSFLLGRLAAKSALGAMLEEPDLAALEIYAGVFGQPLVRHPRALGVDVTLSHSHGVAVALAYPAAWPAGLDLETVAPDAVAMLLAEMTLSDAEKSWVAAAVTPSSACAVLWSAREALGKALKTGVNSPLGVLSTFGIQAARSAAGAPAWRGGYTNFSQFQWRAQIFDERVLVLALPREIELDEWFSS